MSRKHANHLIHEKSPYLLQHAHNPVDWYPWGEEAFEKARREDKPIFLSIGYATCHWCHVMERESFEDEETAKFLNEHFVCIKVDREERPDMDMVYMAAVQAMTGHGGWPLSVFLTPDLKPFYGGTYFPKEPRYGMPSFMQVLREVHRAWQENRANILDFGKRLMQHLQERTSIGLVEYRPTPDLLHDAFKMYLEQFDSTYGGFGGAPKFPRPMDVQFLLRYYRMAKNPKALQMAMQTLDQMANGGIYDQLGGGFHRYATDRAWQIPHFEKMLYDNALLLTAYTEAFQLTQNGRYARIVHETVAYLQREMSSPEGAFYSAQDADSEGQEGKFYTWQESELRRLLTEDEFAVVREYYGVRKEGNFENGRNILHIAQPIAAVSRKLGLSEAAVRHLLESARKKLLEARQHRIPPLTDDKVLTSWNALAISALARAATVFENPRYLRMAEKAAVFLWQRQFRDGRLFHRYRQGETAIDGFLEDYAFLIQACLDLYEANFELQWFERAQQLADLAISRFYDSQNGGFYFTPDSAEEVPRMKDSYDGAVPSGNSMMVLNLLRLAEYTGNDDYREKAMDTMGAFARRLEDSPLSFAQMLLAADFLLAGPREIVFVTPGGSPEAARDFLSALHRRFLPEKVLAVIPADHAENWARLFPWTEGRTLKDGKPTAYVCRNYSCQLPATTVEDFLQQLY